MEIKTTIADTAPLDRDPDEKALAENRLLDKAIIYAVDRHAGQFRKGTTRPYILHPLETMAILHAMNADTSLLMAGVLHDTIEDTDAAPEEIRQLFGDDVAALVTAHSEDKSKTWFERKTHAIEELAQADRRLKMLILADKVANLRDMTANYQQIGDELWDRFNAPAEKQAWYYGGIQDALCQMQDDPDCAMIYWEMVSRYKDLFVTYRLDINTDTLYQSCLDGTCYALSKEELEWVEYDTQAIPDGVLSLSRTQAETLEDLWHTINEFDEE